MELAELKGTEKQVSWAKAIRKDRLKVWQAADCDGFQAEESRLAQQSASSWWITSRDKSLKEACSALPGGVKAGAPKARNNAASKKAVAAVPLRAVRPAAAAGVGQADDGDLWKTVTTATGFMRSGPTRDLATGDVVVDADLPF